MLTIQRFFGAVKCARDWKAVQFTLSNIDQWTRCNNIQFNTSKCKILTVTRKNQPLTYDYNLNNGQLKHVAEREGPWNHRGTSTHHGTSMFCVNAIVLKVNKLLGLLKRTCAQSANVSVTQTLYLSPVKSQLSFGTQLWSPSQSHLQGKMKRVQRRATRRILRSRIGEMSYKERLIILDMLLLVLW